MGRRRKNDDYLLELILKLGGVAIVLSLINPSVRNFISALGSVLVLLLILGVVVLIGILIYKFIQHKRSGSAKANQNRDV